MKWVMYITFFTRVMYVYHTSFTWVMSNVLTSHMCVLEGSFRRCRVHKTLFIAKVGKPFSEKMGAPRQVPKIRRCGDHGMECVLRVCDPSES